MARTILLQVNFMQISSNTKIRSSIDSSQKKNTESKPDELFLLATERFCSTDVHDRLSSHHFKTAFELLYQKVDPASQQIAARLLAFSAAAPRSIIMQLALEDISISKPILLHSKVLGQLDLIRLIESCGEAHAELIASRFDIGPSVVGRLQQFSTGPVYRAIQENPAILKSNTDTEVQQETVSKSGAKESSESQNLALADDQSATLTASERRLLDTAGLSRSSDAAQARQKVDGEQPAMNPGKLGAKLEELAATNSHQQIAELMCGGSSRISLRAAYQALEHQTGESMAVFLKSADIDEACASRILMLCFPMIGLSVRNATGMVKFYSKLDADNCRDAVARWPSQKSGALHQPVYEDGTNIERKHIDRDGALHKSSNGQLEATG